ncbi:MAG: PucR family transcriptional regulator [Firmicutes bacterium]|nr:PucR family transcriptional regulator [Bacillota bacterium]
MAALTLGTVFEQTRKKYDLKLLAGEQGLHRSLRWLYFSEDIENADFLRGGELMLLTGYSFGGQEGFERFVKMLISRDACGVIVNVGKYIFPEDISPELLTLCNERQFPFIIMPWKYHLTDIWQDYGQQIFLRAHEQNRLTYIFQMLLEDIRHYSPEDESRLIANRFIPRGSFCVAVLSWTHRERKPAELLGEVAVVVENHLNQVREPACAFPYRNRQVLVFQPQNVQEMKPMLEELQSYCSRRFPELTFTCALGSVEQGVEQLGESYARALAALSCGVYQGTGFISFEDLGVFRLFFTCRDRSVLDGFSKILSPLEEYDAQYGGQLTETLRRYMQFNGSVNMVSDAMYCHRNTTNYRIKKIKALLGTDLDSQEMLFQLQLAFYIREYQQIYPAAE